MRPNMVKAQIEAYARIRPHNGNASHQSMYLIDKNKKILEIMVPKDLKQGVVNNMKENYAFKFSSVFDQDSSQAEVFEKVAKPVVQNFMEGYNGTIFAYGQTGSGKTFTMNGGESWQQRGIIPRVFSFLFEEVRRRQPYMECNIYASYFEIYNENGYDLLDRKHAEKTFEKWNKISLYEDQNQNLHLKNLTIHSCKNEQDAIDLLMMGNFIRQVSATPMNPSSSRSHCIFTLALESKCFSDPNVIRTSKLHLVDLAGSERVYKSDPDTLIKREAKYINRSLSYLEQVIIALHEKANGQGRTHVPYRNSMMTSILRDSLGGNCKTVMVANISPDLHNEEESISTARFALRCSKLINEIRVNEIVDVNIVVKRLESENDTLKKTINKQDDIIK